MLPAARRIKTPSTYYLWQPAITFRFGIPRETNFGLGETENPYNQCLWEGCELPSVPPNGGSAKRVVRSDYDCDEVLILL